MQQVRRRRKRRKRRRREGGGTSAEEKPPDADEIGSTLLEKEGKGGGERGGGCVTVTVTPQLWSQRRSFLFSVVASAVSERSPSWRSPWHAPAVLRMP